MSSTGCFVVSPAKVVTAIAFQAEMTAGSPAGAGDGVAVALAVPAASATGSSTAAQEASHLRPGTDLRADDDKSLWNACISPPAFGGSP
jgi:hypothetical protein